MDRLQSHLKARGIDPGSINPGARPDYSFPKTWPAIQDLFSNPQWDANSRSRMWDREAMAKDLQGAFFNQLRLPAPR
jgi:hypothetical protein